MDWIKDLKDKFDFESVDEFYKELAKLDYKSVKHDDVIDAWRIYILGYRDKQNDEKGKGDGS